MATVPKPHCGRLAARLMNIYQRRTIVPMVRELLSAACQPLSVAMTVALFKNYPRRCLPSRDRTGTQHRRGDN
jgi:hypothetical protein